jgi:biotin/methionine sulfoxide reductase
MLALAHVLVTEDRHDQDYLERCCHGSDRFIAYVLGEADGVAKSPEWAAPICGLPAADIRALAREMAAHRTLITVSYSLQRAEHGEQPVWACHRWRAARPDRSAGGGFGHGYGSMGDVGSASAAVPLARCPRAATRCARSSRSRIADLLLHPGEAFDYDGSRLTYPDIRMVYWAGGNPFHHHQDLNRFRRALGRPDTVIVHEPYWTPMARHADVVLPATTSHERNDLGAGRTDARVIAMHQLVEPAGEARNDHDILAGLAARLGVHGAFTDGRDERAWIEHLYSRLCDGLRERGEDPPDFDRFWADGSLAIPDVDAERVLLSAYRSDPDGHPLRTPSGRIELFSETVAGFGYQDCPGHPTWLAGTEWLGSPRAEQFPLALVANNPATRLHSQHDSGPYSQASKVAGREPVRLHPDDAEARGIESGDVVRLFNDRGACLAGAVVSDAVRPGVVQLATGAWFDPDDPTAELRPAGTATRTCSRATWARPG